MIKRCFVGFDGFIDTLVSVIKSRKTGVQSTHETFSTIEEWGHSLLDAAGKSCNYELLQTGLCAGGNAINLGRALTSLGHQICCAANVGKPSSPSEIDPIFKPYLCAFDTMINLGAAGQTHALEFGDGKLLLGIQGKNALLSLEDIENLLGKGWQEHFLWNQDLIALVNWTMTPSLGSIWRYLAQNPPQTIRKRILLIDFADPKKRDPKELERDIQYLEPLTHCNITIVLSFNKSEAEQALAALNQSCRSQREPTDELKFLAEQIRQKLPSFVIVIHDRKQSVLSQKSGTFVRLSKIIEYPLVLTGGGDHFNAGLAHGLLNEKDPESCLDMAMKCACYYIEKGQSPSAQDLS